MGIVHKKQFNYDLAHECFQNSLRIQKIIYPSNKHVSIVITLDEIVDTYTMQDNYELAFQYLEKSAKISNLINGEKDKKSLIKTTVNVAFLLRECEAPSLDQK